jgi:hypothetical protein
MGTAFTSYGRAVAVIFACAFAVFFAQESQSTVALGLGAVILGVGAVASWFRLRGTPHRFIVGICSVVSITFLTFLVNGAYPNSGPAAVSASILVASLSFFTIYAFLDPSRGT